MERKMEARNFGLKSRDMAWALSNAYKLSSNSFKSVATAQSAFNSFKEHLNDMGIKDLRKVDKEHVKSFGIALIEGNKSPSTIQNYISFINIALSNARMDNQCRVDAVKELNAPIRTGIQTTNKSVNDEQFKKLQEQVNERLSAQLNLQREFALRFKESCLIDARAALKEATQCHTVTITLGTKGGRERVVPLENRSQIEALKEACRIQQQDPSMIPKNQTFKEYQRQSYNQLRETNSTFHAQRHTYANAIYEKITGVQSPIASGIKHKEHHAYVAEKLNITIPEAKEIDKKARLEVANRLGHNRIDVTNSYLG